MLPVAPMMAIFMILPSNDYAFHTRGRRLSHRVRFSRRRVGFEDKADRVRIHSQLGYEYMRRLKDGLGSEARPHGYGKVPPPTLKEMDWSTYDTERS